MSKRNKHHKPKGPKSPPQNVVSEEKQVSEEQPVIETKPDNEAKPVTSAVAPEVKLVTPEVKPETSVPKEDTNKKSDVADSAKSSEVVDSPVKPKRHRNRKNKHKDYQGNVDDSKDDADDEVKVLSEVDKCVKVEENKNVEKVSETEVKSEPSEQKDSEPKKSGRNKKKDKKDGHQTAPEKTENIPIISEVQITPEVSTPVAEDKSKKGNKSDAQTQVKGGKGKQGKSAATGETKQDEGNSASISGEKAEDAQCSKKEEGHKEKDIEETESKLSEETNKAQQQGTKPDSNKKGKNKKSHERNKDDEQVSPVTLEKKDEAFDKPSEHEKPTLSKDSKQDSEIVKEKSKESGGNKTKGKHKQDKGIQEDNKIEEGNTKVTDKSIEQTLIEEVKATELSSEIQACEVKQCDVSKGKKQKGKHQPATSQPTETPVEKCELVSLSSILGEIPTTDIKQDESPKCPLAVEKTLSVKKDRKSKSKTPETESKSKHDKPEISNIQEVEKKGDQTSEIIKSLEVKDIAKQRSKTPEIPGSAQVKEKSIKLLAEETINILGIKTEALQELPILGEKVKEETHKQLIPTEHKKGRSKTPEINISKEDTPQVKQELSNLGEKKEEIKIQEKSSKIQKSKDSSQHKKQGFTPIATDIQEQKELPVSAEIKESFIPISEEFEHLKPKDKKKGRSKTPEIKVIPDITGEKVCIKDENIGGKVEQPVCSLEKPTKSEDQQVGKPMDHIKTCSKKQRKSRSRTPEVNVESTKVKEKPADDILPSIASSIEETLEKLVSECETIGTKKQEEFPDVTTKITDSAKVTATEQKGESFTLGNVEIKSGTEEKHDDVDTAKGQDKHKKNKKSGKKETKSHTEDEKHKEDDKKIVVNLPGSTSGDVCTLGTLGAKCIQGISERKGEFDRKETIQKIEEFVIQNPISEDIISTLLSDIPPEFIDADIKPHNEPMTSAEIATCPITVCPIRTSEPEKPVDCPLKDKLFASTLETKCEIQEKVHGDIKQPDEHAHDKGNKNKSKKHDKKKGHHDETKLETEPKGAPQKQEEISLPEPSITDTPQEAQAIDIHKTVEADSASEPKPTKRNKDKKHNKEVHGQATESSVIPESKPLAEEPVLTEIISPSVEITLPGSKTDDAQQFDKSKVQCKPECEIKPCESCPKKKKSGKGKPSIQTLEQELAAACHLEKPEHKGEDVQTPNISFSETQSPETSTKIEQKEIAQATPENFEFLKLPDESKLTDAPDSQTKDKNKRGSKSPAKQSKNLHGPSSSPAKSSKCDYKKEKNKGDKKSPPDLSQTPSGPEAKSQETKCEVDESSQCQKKTDKKDKNKVEQTAGSEVVSIENIEDLEEEFVYKYSFRTVFIANACHICKIQLKDDRVVCRFCHLVCYCTEGHRDDDWASHQSLCYAICTLSHVKAQDHIYGDAKSLSGQDYRLLRMQGIVSCEKILKRKLCPWEQEVLLYPRMCLEPTCREWRSGNLKDCDGCGQISYCTAHPTHLPTDHASWCASYRLYHRLVAHQLHQGRIEPTLPTKVFQQDFHLPDDTSTLYDTLYGGHQQMDECYHATLTQLSTAPLTALYAYQKSVAGVTTVPGGQPTTSKILTKSALCIHIIGAELQFEADTLNKWESFFLHLTPGLQDLRIVFIGPELNTSNLPVDLLSRIRMCQLCKEGHRIVRFEFHDSMLYHDFVESSKFSKPDLICAFNPGFHRATGYAGLDTWPETIAAALRLRVPLCITAYTQYEMPRDLARVHTVCPNAQIKVGPFKNPYASLRPDRNFISDDEMPLIFKNYQFALVSL